MQGLIYDVKIWTCKQKKNELLLYEIILIWVPKISYNWLKFGFYAVFCDMVNIQWLLEVNGTNNDKTLMLNVDDFVRSKISKFIFINLMSVKCAYCLLVLVPWTVSSMEVMPYYPPTVVGWGTGNDMPENKNKYPLILVKSSI